MLPTSVSDVSLACIIGFDKSMIVKDYICAIKNVFYHAYIQRRFTLRS